MKSKSVHHTLYNNLFIRKIVFQICGDLECCYTPWLQGSFTEGGIDYFENDQLGECGNQSDIIRNDDNVNLGMLSNQYFLLLIRPIE